MPGMKSGACWKQAQLPAYEFSVPRFTGHPISVRRFIAGYTASQLASVPAGGPRDLAAAVEGVVYGGKDLVDGDAAVAARSFGCAFRNIGITERDVHHGQQFFDCDLTIAVAVAGAYRDRSL